MSGDNASASRLDAADLQALLDGGAQFDERELRAVIETSPELIAITGEDGLFQLLNRQWERSLGWSREELRSRPFITFVHPDDVESTGVVAQRMLAEKALLAFHNRYQCKDGSYRSLQWRGFFDRTTARFYTVTTDQSEILAARAETEAFSALCEITPAVVIMEDADGLVRRWDGAMLKELGWEPHQRLGEPLSQVLRAVDGVTPVSLGALLDDCDDEDNIPARLLLPSGETAPIHLAAREFGDGLAPIVGTVACVRPGREN